MQEIVLRPRQLHTIQGLREGIKAGHHAQILMAGTGAGKTVCGTFLVQECVRKSRKALFICDRIQLVNQTSTTFFKHGIDHGIYQAGHHRWKPWLNAQVCSAQTLMRRGIPEGVDLVIVDEAHTVYDVIKELIELRKDVIFIGLSATPFTKGLGKLYTNVVNAMTTNDLLAEGWLTPMVVYVGKKANLEGVKTNSKGEWKEEEVSKRNLEIVGDIVTEWVDKTGAHFGGPVKTIAFSATVDDGAIMCKKFNERGYRFEQVSYLTTDSEYKELMAEFSKPDTDIMGMVSVEKLSKGFDLADIKCGIDARPLRKSLSGHMQMIGRPMRPLFGEGDLESIEGRKEAMAQAGKSYFVWLCHSGNYMRFRNDRDDIYENGLDKLDERGLDDAVRKDPEEKEFHEVVCKGCKLVLAPDCYKCPRCGLERERRASIEHVVGEMVRVEETDKPLLNASTGKPLPDWMKDKSAIWEQICAYAMTEKRGDFEKARKMALASYRGFYGAWPGSDFTNNPLTSVDPRLASKCHTAKLQYFKKSAAAKREAKA